MILIFCCFIFVTETCSCFLCKMKLYMESSSYSQHSKEIQLQKCKNPYLISQRQKQINFGKNTEGYKTYLRLVPK